MKLLEYQQQIHDKLISMPACALFLEMGFGKTAIMLNVINTLLSTQASRALVIAPPHVASLVWGNEARLFTPHLTYTSVLSGTSALKRQKIMQDNSKSPADFCILSTSMVNWFFANNYHLNYTTLIIDESTKFKSYRSVTFRTLKAYLSHFTNRYIMTGTPIPNGYEDLWSQIYILDQGDRLGSNITTYRNRYFTKYPYNPYKHFLLPGSEDKINEAIADITIARSLKNTTIELPPQVSEVQYADMPLSLLRAYNKLKKDFILEYRNTPLQYEEDPNTNSINIVATTQATLTNKLLQFCSGSIYNENTPDYITLHDLKLQLFQDVLNNFNEKILVAYNYNHEALRILHAFPNDTIRYDGDPQTILKWTEGTTPRVLLAHPQSIAYGLNLQHACNVAVWFGFTWNLELYQQFNKRLHRRGQQHTVYIIHLAVGNIEYKLMERLKSKDITQQSLMQYMQTVGQATDTDVFRC